MFYMEYQKMPSKNYNTFSVLKDTYTMQAMDKVEYECFCPWRKISVISSWISFFNIRPQRKIRTYNPSKKEKSVSTDLLFTLRRKITFISSCLLRIYIVSSLQISQHAGLTTEYKLFISKYPVSLFPWWLL